MKNQESIKVTGFCFLELFDKDGNLKEKREYKNVFTQTGMDYMVDCLMQTEEDQMRYIGIGTDNSAAASNDTALGVERGTRASGTITDGGKTYTVEYTFLANNPGTPYALVEAGLFSTISGASMGSRQTFSVINKGTSDTFKVTWRYVFS